MTLPDILLGGLAAWRIAAMISYERGPLAIFQRLRGLFGIDHFDNGMPDCDGYFEDSPPHVREGAGLLCCVWCSSMWTSLLCVMLLAAWPAGGRLILAPFALSALAIVMEKINHG
jgi:hypothetical protein